MGKAWGVWWMAVAATATPAAGRGVEPSSFAIVARPVDRAAVVVARPGRALVELAARPTAAASLRGAVPPEVAKRLGVKRAAPFDAGRTLYGWRERPGLYCDLLRSSGLGLSAACLQDTDGDGRFDQGRRLGFDSTAADLLLITPGGKIVGARFKGAPTPLPTPVPYSIARPSADVVGRLAVRWRVGDGGAVEIVLSTPPNGTDTMGFAPRVLRVAPGPRPIDVELYGIRLRILGLDGEGALRCSVLGVADGAPVPLSFLGVRTVVIGY